jgi:hypothetical protein
MKPVFIHISKNAGTSVVRTAGSAIRVAGHRTAASWIAGYGRSAPLFAVHRNPFDRVVSEYFYRRRRFLGGEKNPHLSNLGKSFDEWVISTFRDGEYRTRAYFEANSVPYNRANMIGDCLIWFLPQTRWICGEEGAVLVDEILRYETLDEDWEQFAMKYGIGKALTHHNASNRERDYNAYYSPRSREVVQEYFASDFDAFGYKSY